MKRAILVLMMCMVALPCYGANKEVYFEVKKVIYDRSFDPPKIIKKLPIGDLPFGRYLISTNLRGFTEKDTGFEGNCAYHYFDDDKVLAKCNAPEKNINNLKNSFEATEIFAPEKIILLQSINIKQYVKPELEIMQIVKKYFKKTFAFLTTFAFADQSYSDGFTDLDDWTQYGVNNFSIYSGIRVNAAGCGSDGCAMYYDSNMDTDDMYATVLYVSITSSYEEGLTVRYDVSGTDGYAGTYSDGTDRGYIYRIDNNVLTELANTSRNPSNGNTLKIDISGTTLTLYYSSTQDAQITDSTYSAGKSVGMIAFNGGWMDNWTAIDTGSAAGRRRMWIQ